MSNIHTKRTSYFIKMFLFLILFFVIIQEKDVYADNQQRNGIVNGETYSYNNWNWIFKSGDYVESGSPYSNVYNNYDYVTKSYTASSRPTAESMNKVRIQVDGTYFRAFHIIFYVKATYKDGSTKNLISKQWDQGQQSREAYPCYDASLANVGKQDYGKYDSGEVAVPNPQNVAKIDVYYETAGYRPDLTFSAYVTAPHSHSYTLTTDNSKIRSNATTSAAATYWNKCSCGTFATSGTYYHSVGKPLVSYTSGVPATKSYNKGDKVTLTANFANAASYQWYKNGVSMGSSYRSATLDLGVQNTLALSGTNYKCIATGYNGNTGLNAATTATSTVCTLSGNQTSFVPKVVYVDRNGQPRSDLTVQNRFIDISSYNQGRIRKNIEKRPW